jgi:uncharacterized protein (TIGR04255 family)
LDCRWAWSLKESDEELSGRVFDARFWGYILSAAKPAGITYDNPPLIEVAMSVQFEPPSGLTMAHLGAYWWLNRESYPVVVDAKPISASKESFRNQEPWFPPSLRFAITDQINFRLQMKSSDEQWVCQIQQDRFVVNWRKQEDRYPRFREAWERFQRDWTSWNKFLTELYSPASETIPYMWELAYVNRIPKGTLWKSPADWDKIFPSLCVSPSDSNKVGSLQGVRGQWIWDSSDPTVRLNVELVPRRFRGSPDEDSLMLNLTARGPIDVASCGKLTAIQSGMDCGHSMIVSMFDSLASPTAKQKWNRQP